MPIVLALLLAAADAPPATASAGAAPNEIVVRGASLRSLEDDLNRCIAERCPVRADVIASVRYAEGLFRVGRYQDSRRVLQKAIDRDKSGGHADPFAVAGLYEATATVARHDGEQAVVADAVHARARLLRETQPADSADLLRAELDEADLAYERSGPQYGLGRYRALEARATALGRPGIAAAAVIRQAQAQRALRNTPVARRLLDRVIAEGDAVPPGYRLSAYALKARLPHDRSDTSAEDALRAALAHVPQATPVLVYAPLPPAVSDAVDLDYYNFTDNVSHGIDFANLRWADIGFSIRPDGTVEEPEMLRGTLPKGDAKAIAANVARRLYAASQAAGDRYRIERWTLTADYGTPAGSLIRRRYVHPHYEVLDVTTGTGAPARAGAAS